MDLIWLVGVLVLVLSALSVRRLSFGFVVRSLVSWALIIVLTVLAVAHRNEIGALFAAAIGKARPRRPAGRRQDRAHPHGARRPFLGARDAQRRRAADADRQRRDDHGDLGRRLRPANIGTSNGLPAMIETANGTVAAKRGRIEKLAIGPLETEDLGVVVSESFGDLDVLGMNFLSRLHSWRVENRTLILEPKAGASDEGSDATTAPSDAGERRRAPRGASESDEDI
jgi:aspartyl protease family protein